MSGKSSTFAAAFGKGLQKTEPLRYSVGATIASALPVANSLRLGLRRGPHL